MSNEKLPDWMDDPHPLEPSDTVDVLTGLVGLVLIPVSVLLALNLGVMPRRTAGATRSAQLIWQQRQAEIQQAIAAGHAGEATVAPQLPPPETPPNPARRP